MTDKKEPSAVNMLLELAKVRITVAVSLTTIAGYLLWSGTFTLTLVGVVIGIFLLACGSSVINHIQDQRYDLRMTRTKNRPLPTEKITPEVAWITALILIFIGGILLYFVSGWKVLGLGLLAIGWYNGIYAYVKRVTAYAVIPGSVIGALPPVIGWVSAGGLISDPRMWHMALFFFVWQVPHFWLLMIRHREDYVRTGYPSLAAVMSQKKIYRMIYFWVVATFLVTALLPVTGLIDQLLPSVGIWVLSAYLLFVFTRGLVFRSSILTPRYYFMQLNYFVVGTVIFMMLDAVLR